MAFDWMDDDEWKSRWKRASDREKVVASLILGAFFLGIGACALFSRLDMGHSLADPVLWGLPLVGLVFLFRAFYITVKQRRISPKKGKIGALLSAEERIARKQMRRISPEEGKTGVLPSTEERMARKQRKRISLKKGKIGALLFAEERIARKQKRRFFSGNDIVVALVFIPIGLFVLLLGFNAASEARRIASYPVLVGPGFEAMPPGEHAVIVGVLEGNAPVEQELQLVAYSREQWHVDRDPGDETTGHWRDLGTHVPGLAVSLDGATVRTAWRDSGVLMQGKRHEAIYHRGSGVVYKGVSDGSRRVIGFKNGDLVTVVGEKDANGTLIPEILYGGELEQLLSGHRGSAWSQTLAGGFLIALVPLAWLAMRLYRQIRAGFRKLRV